MRLSAAQEGQLQLVDLAVNATLGHPDDRVLAATNPPNRMLLAEDGKADAGNSVLTNASHYGNTLNGLRKSGKLTIPIHMRKRGSKVRGGT